MVKKAGLDRLVGPVLSGTGWSDGPKIVANCSKHRIGKNLSNSIGLVDSVKPANSRFDRLFQLNIKGAGFFSFWSFKCLSLALSLDSHSHSHSHTPSNSSSSMACAGSPSLSPSSTPTGVLPSVALSSVKRGVFLLVLLVVASPLPTSPSLTTDPYSPSSMPAGVSPLVL